MERKVDVQEMIESWLLWISVVLLIISNVCLTIRIKRIEHKLAGIPMPADITPSAKQQDEALPQQEEEEQRRMESCRSDLSKAIARHRGYPG